MAMEGIDPGSPRPMRQLQSDLQLHVLSFLPPNDCALSGRLACRDAAQGLSGPQYSTASLFQPLPPHAAPWAVEAAQQRVRQLPFRHKLQLLYTAATSGSEVNLEVALALLQPSIFPELLQRRISQYADSVRGQDPGVAAVEAGHLQLLGWLLCRCPGLVCPDGVLAAAARRCDLAGLQAVWEQFSSHHRSSTSVSNVKWGNAHDRPILGRKVLNAAAASTAPDAVAKMAWLIAVPASSFCRLQDRTAAAAAQSGDVGRLGWLREQGCPMGGEGSIVLLSALQHADLAVVQWLVNEAGVELPAAGSGVEGWDSFLKACFSSSDGLAKVRWLQQRGAPPLTADLNGKPAVRDWACSAIESGRVETMQYLLSTLGPRELPLGNAELCTKLAAKSGSIPMAECLRGAGLVFTRQAYTGAAEAGSLAMVRWLAHDAKVPTGANLRQAQNLLQQFLGAWPCTTPADSRDLLEAVQLLVGAGVDGVAVAGVDADDAEDEDLGGWGEEIAAHMALSGALQRGDLALVQYLQEQQQLVPLLPGPDDVETAAQAGCEALLEWLVDLPGCLEGPGDRPYVAAAANGDLGTLAALRRLGVPWGSDDELVDAIEWRCCEPALRWLAGQGMPVGGAEEMEEAVAFAEKVRDLSAEAAAWLRGLAAGGAAAGAEGQGA